jgi:hypothetical protein
MDPKLIQKISSQVYRQYPEVAGASPKLRSLPIVEPHPLYLLTYHGKANTANGKFISRFIRVTVDHHGKILKITTSR